jgi:RimJ/RimL family protein N-acetyltransferase
MAAVHRRNTVRRKAGPSGLVELRRVRVADLPEFFDHQLDPEASRMAAFGNRDSANRDLFLAHWQESLQNHKADWKSVLVDGRLVGYVGLFELFGKPSVAYWYSREVWGRGVATFALQEFLRSVATRPVFARVAADNLGSIRVLEKAGFTVIGREKNFAELRGEEIEELVFRRDAT